jgi:hypothetical protein
MLAALLAYTHLSPLEYEGEAYFALDPGAELTSIVAMAALAWLVVYFAAALGSNRSARSGAEPAGAVGVHPGEWWVVLAHAIAFGSGYVFGAANASFLLVLAVHHELQYLYFVYAMSRRAAIRHETIRSETEPAMSSYSSPACKRERHFRSELAHAAGFLAWPVIGFSGAVAGGWLALEWLAPLGVGGLFCHYWLDSRIWTRRALAI